MINRVVSAAKSEMKFVLQVQDFRNLKSDLPTIMMQTSMFQYQRFHTPMEVPSHQTVSFSADEADTSAPAPGRSSTTGGVQSNQIDIHSRAAIDSAQDAPRLRTAGV